MPSSARNELDVRLKDVDELISAHGVVTGGGVGRPAQRQGAAITRSGVVLLAASMEAFVEDLFEEAAAIVFGSCTEDERKELFKQTSRRLNNADVHKTNLLYFNLGIPWILSGIRWKKFSNESFRKSLNKLVETRNQIAHGKRPSVTLPQLRRWKTMTEMYAKTLEREISTYISTTHKKDTGW